ncbi:MAG: hypothetical protein AB7G25_03360 [Sphingomonadaceae bacterium]
MTENPIDLDKPLFPISVVALGSRRNPSTMRAWIQRGRVTLSPSDEPASTPGETRLLTFRTALTFGATAALVRQGVDPADAFEAAKSWTHSGDSLGVPPHNLPREPAGLYGDAWYTLMLYFGEGKRPTSIIPVPIQAEDIVTLPRSWIFGEYLPACTIVTLDGVYYQMLVVCNGYLRDTAEIPAEPTDAEWTVRD